MITKRKLKKNEKYCPWHGFHIYWLLYQAGFGGEAAKRLAVCAPCQDDYEAGRQSISPTILTNY